MAETITTAAADAGRTSRSFTAIRVTGRQHAHLRQH